MTGYIEEGQRGGARLALGGGRRRSRSRRRLLRRADDLRRRDAGHAHRQGGDLRAGPVGPDVRGRGRGDPDRQRRHVRPGGDASGRPTSGAPSGSPSKIDAGHHLDELPALPAGQRAVRGPQDVRPRRGPRGRGAPDVHPPQDPLHQLRRRRRWHGREPCDHRRPGGDPRPVPPGARDHLPRQRDVRAAAAGDRRRAGPGDPRLAGRAPATGSTDWDAPTDQAPRDFARLIGRAGGHDRARSRPRRSGPGSWRGCSDPATRSSCRPTSSRPACSRSSSPRSAAPSSARSPFDELAASIGPATTLVAFSLVQMQTGKMADLEAITAAAGRHGARIMIDATQAVPFVPLDGRHRPDRLPRRARATSTCCRRAARPTSTSGATTGTSSSHATPTGARRTCRTAATSAGR